MIGRVHPAVVGWELFKKTRPNLFEGTAEGRYLENRLKAAYEAGWLDLEKRIRAASGELVERPTSDDSQ